MDIATFNVNSIRARLEILLDWLREARPDVVCLQEIKVVDEAFPREPIEELGYNVAVHGQKTYNGVAILSRWPLEDVSTGISDFQDPQARVLEAHTGGVTVVCVYVPNGSEVGSEKYDYKLAWLDAFHAALRARFSMDDPLAILGDYNIAPDDRDVWNPERWRGRIHCSEPERERYRALTSWGLADALRLHTEEPGIYTWWDYRLGAYRRGWGMRLDHALISPPLARRCEAVRVNEDLRSRPRPSDHVPLVLTLS